jgi:hypothetical protein
MDQLRKKLKTDDEGESCLLYVIIWLQYTVKNNIHFKTV